MLKVGEGTDHIIRNLALSLIFGALSFLFGQVQFSIPGVDGSLTSLNEVPSLISVFYLSSPVYLLIVAGLSSLGTPAEGSAVSTLLFHLCGLIPFWYYHKYFLKGLDLKILILGARTSVGVIVYYLVLVVPIMILTNRLFGVASGPFGPVYLRVITSAAFEITTTTLIITLYLLQLNANNRLKEHLLELEEKVKERTAELDRTIQKLNETNLELESMNVSLDLKVISRTKELENRNVQLTGYAFINSHLLRAPLARLLGLANLIRSELQQLDDVELMDKFLITCNELDAIVKLLGEFLSEESVLSKHQLDELQKRIRQIAVEIKEIS